MNTGNSWRASLLATVFLGLNLVCIHSLALAAEPWPTKPIKIIVPFSPGSVQDALARSFSNELGAALGEPVVVENKAGAGGTVGTGIVGKATPDGYTFLLAAASHNINGSLFNKLSFDPIKDFTGAAYIGTSSYIMMTNADFPAKSVSEFIALAKANPGQYNYASAGNGSASHLAMAYFDSMAGIQLVHIPTKGTGDAITELLAGRAQAVIAANVAALPFANDPRIRFLGVSSEKPSPFVPGVPTIGMTLKGYVFDSWFGLLAPAATPQPVIAKLQSEMAKLLKQPEIVERMRRQGIEIGNLSPAEFNQLLVRDYVRMANVVKASGAKAE
ncbi:tripartite tricarboxylate transporter substrate binding protein [Polynucleobacter sp. MWH-Braz-FAM2G]|uniref:tripartite tricarboxylate transporter substrate binding protein n=1 Tax=Polynucleobacter sp. MWH-Braz-FAM2G TaxID=1855883 RepID=UPI001BFEBD62|nr:tripartite tricarboxylate transporter substrate binding protein [Polynucleobacter sp. MWH-Braz-FAM2G]QWD90067.1 tripartite tricarboxylate transporter substrate binding protein [Polynucleobacter sp. MWH-Braz-FAM2G]